MIPPPSKETGLLLLGLAVLVGGLGSRRLRPASDGVGDVSVEPPAFDFGKIRQGETLKHTFRLANGGKVAIIITKTESSCSCTTAENLESRTIAPGGAIEVPVSLKTGIVDGPESGQITLYFRSSSRADAAVYFRLIRVTADVQPDYRVRPTLIDFGTIDHLDPITRTVRLRPEELSDVKIARLSTSHGALTARRVDMLPGEIDQAIEITFSGRSLWKSGSIETTASIETTSPRNPITHVLTRARFVAPVEVEPTSIVVNSATSGTVGREIQIDAARPVRIKALRSSDSSVSLAGVGPAAGRSLRILATIAGDPRHAINAEASIELEPVLRTAATGARTVTIPIHRLAPKE